MIPDLDLTEQQQLLVRLGKERELAHQVIFAAKHPQKTPDFHYRVMALWASAAQHVLVMAFRGAGKSTLAEQAIILSACYREFSNCIILGNTWTMAVERLQKIRTEFETNAYLEGLFGNLVGPTWTDDRLVLANGVVIQALGRGQSLRGTKYIDARPDLAFLDDIEDSDSCANDEAIAKTMRWLLSEVVPAMAPGYRMRLNGTPLHPSSALMQLARRPSWRVLRVPVKHIDANGSTCAAWPARFPLSEIDRLEKEFAGLGMSRQFAQEYMCEAEDIAGKPFDRTMFKVEPRVRLWEAVYSVYDPARTVNKTSAHTGMVTYSWLGNRLVVWDAVGRFWKPDEIVASMFDVAREYNPTAIFVERNGLEEWLMQPIRQEQARRGFFFPVIPVNAPRGKENFIMQLQPFFKAGEVIFNKPLPDLEQQLLNFPTGRIDVPNALAYALSQRPGVPVYEGFNSGNVVEDMPINYNSPLWLAINATAQHTTGAVVQVADGGLNVYADFVREGGPGDSLQGIVADARVVAGRGHCAAMALPRHFDGYDTVGLIPAANHLPLSVRVGGQAQDGRAVIRKLLKETRKGRPAVQVSSAAAWTLRGFAGGFCYFVDKKSGALSDFPVPGAYQTLIEGIEAVAALTAVAEAEDERHYAYTLDGRKYLTSRGGELAGSRPSKSDWADLLRR